LIQNGLSREYKIYDFNTQPLSSDSSKVTLPSTTQSGGSPSTALEPKRANQAAADGCRHPQRRCC
ncbi:hypothetical protein BOX15_Mlig006650g1, partial [Macrostomum lignano]